MNEMLKRGLCIIGLLIIASGVGYGIINYDCTDYDCGEKTITECEDWDTNQQIGVSIAILGAIVFILGAVLPYDAKGENHDA